MRTRKIQLSRVFQTLLALLLSGSPTLMPSMLYAQCTAGNIAQTITYSTTISGSGSGAYDLTSSLPKFTPSTGTLIAAVINSRVTTNMTLKLTNTGSSAVSFVPGISRADYIKLDNAFLAYGSANYNYSFTTLGAAGAANDHITYGPSYVFNNVELFRDSVTTADTALTGGFEGAGYINLQYNASTSLTAPVAVVSTPTINDAVTVSVTYYYCTPSILSSNILTFTATRQDEQTIALNWITTNETAGRTYFIEVSHDGKSFSTIGSRASEPLLSDASYIYDYTIQSSDAGTLYFRLRQVESDGKVSYSPIRSVQLDGGSGSDFSIYPNPATDFINVTLPGGYTDWQLDIIAADGSLVQRNFAVTSAIRILFHQRLAAGTYFVRATSVQGGKTHAGSFVLH